MQLEFQHTQEYAGITLALGMTPSPIVEITGVLGTEGLVIGGELAIDHTRGISLNKYNAGIGFARPDFNASIILYVIAIPTCSLHILIIIIIIIIIYINFLFHKS
jgi:hypothetical protein